MNRMNMSDYVTYLYDYDNFTTCEQGSSQELSSQSLVLPIFYCVLFVLALLGNIMVLWLLLRYIRLKTMTDVCLLNLAMSDLILAISLPLLAGNYTNLASCKLMTAVYQLGFYSGTLLVTLMSVDRYLAIVHAVAAMGARTLHYGIIATTIVWLISGMLATPQVIFASLEESDDGAECQRLYPDDSVEFWMMQRNFTENTVGLFVCLPIMIFCYVRILFALSKARNSNKVKAVKLIFTIVCVFVVCWVPYNVTVFLQTLQLFNMLNNCVAFQTINSATGIAEIIAASHCCLNPIIYALVGEKFRRSLRKALAGYFCFSHQRVLISQRDTTDRETSNTAVKSDY